MGCQHIQCRRVNCLQSTDTCVEAQVVVFAVALVVATQWLSPQLLHAQETEVSKSRTVRFVEQVEESGIDFIHSDGASGRHYVIEPFTAGVAVFDYDNDGWQDIYFLSGSPLPGTPDGDTPTNRLYRNNSDWTFSDVTEQAGVGDAGYGMAVVAGDIDNDGDADLYVANYGANVLYRNNGDGTFANDTRSANVEGGKRFGAGVAFLDIENDGDLDLYCANYQKFSFDRHIVRKIGKYQFHPGPTDYPPEQDQLFQNNGDGTFSDVSKSNGIDTVAATGMGVIAGDFDGDRDTDIFVANDSQPNFLWVNDGSGQFSEEGTLSGLAYDRAGRLNGNMGVDCRDVDADGLLDLVTTTYEGEMPVLYKNLGAGFFSDVTNTARLATELTPHVSWGVGLEDFDNDTDADLFIACGHFKDNIQFVSDRTQMKVRNYLMQNDGHGIFSLSTPAREDALGLATCSRGAGFADFDNDGDQDAVVVNFNAAPNLLKNELAAGSSWINVRLVGTESSRDAAGALITVKPTGSKPMVAFVHAGRGYQSDYGRVVHFGLPTEAEGVSVHVVWPSGHETDYSLSRYNREVVLVER